MKKEKIEESKSTIILEENVSDSNDDVIIEMQESLIEVEEKEPETPEEDLDEFEIRLRKLRERRG